MKALLINGSPKANGTTGGALRYVAEELERAGIEADIRHVGGQVKHGCTDCRKCRTYDEPRCVFDDDPVNDCIRAAEEAQGLVIAAPVYYSGIAGTMKCFLDRFFFPGPRLSYKPAAAFVCLRRGGGVAALDSMQHYFGLSRSLQVPTSYWASVHGNNPEQLREDEEGVFLLREIGRNMAWLMRTLDESNVPLPTAQKRPMTNFVRE